MWGPVLGGLWLVNVQWTGHLSLWNWQVNGNSWYCCMLSSLFLKMSDPDIAGYCCVSLPPCGLILAATCTQEHFCNICNHTKFCPFWCSLINCVEQFFECNGLTSWLFLFILDSFSHQQLQGNSYRIYITFASQACVPATWIFLSIGLLTIKQTRRPLVVPKKQTGRIQFVHHNPSTLGRRGSGGCCVPSGWLCNYPQGWGFESFS
jgi:hypothetical protein